MVDFRKWDKIWKKRHEHRSNLEWRVKYLKEACNALSDICRSNLGRRHNVADVDVTVKTLRDALYDKGKWRSQTDITASPTSDCCSPDDSATGRKPVLLESIISQMCELYTHIEQERQSYSEQMKCIMGEARELSSNIRTGLHTARRKYDEAVENHKRVQHSISRIRHAASLNSSFNDNGERIARLSNAGEREYHAARNREVQADHLHCEILKRASMEIEVVALFIKFIEAEANVMQSTAQLLRNNIPIWQKQLKDYIFQPVYGLDLDIHLQIRGRPLAYVIETCINALSTENVLTCEGLFRVTPNTLKLKKMVSELNLCAHESISEDYDCHVIAGALKQYLRDLPRSLMIGPSLPEHWMEAARITDPTEHLKAVKALTRSLPDSYYMNLRFVISFLNRVTQHQDVNKMNANNIAICMACSLCFSEGDRRTLSCAPSLVGFLIQNYGLIFCEDDVSITAETWENDAITDGPTDTQSCKADSPPSQLGRRKFSSPVSIARSSKGRAPPPPNVNTLSSSVSSLAINASSNSVESNVASAKSSSIVSFELEIVKHRVESDTTLMQQRKQEENDDPYENGPPSFRADSIDETAQEWPKCKSSRSEAAAIQTP